MRIEEVARTIEDYAPASSGIAGDELGLLAGDPCAEVTGVVTCWSPTLAVLHRAAEIGANLVIGHEPLTYRVCGRDPEAGLTWYQERHPTAKIPNQKRLGFVAARGLSVYRYHSNWDWAGRFGMVDMLARSLELGDRTGGEKFAPVYTVRPTTVGQLCRLAQGKLETGPLRVVGNPDREVTRVAICQGGFGQMFTFPELPLAGGAEVAFFGEMLDYTIRYCVEIDLAAVELGHYHSEHPGMIGMAEFLRERLPENIPVFCLPTGRAWTIVND
ncbi:MAG: Nif3-like dinuclear metal center hexameric protein [Pirellulales bacterium]|nr:Nif3-like dinuclear metal center hexameric protein [Pirellulales bacterium]